MSRGSFYELIIDAPDIRQPRTIRIQFLRHASIRTLDGVHWSPVHDNVRRRVLLSRTRIRKMLRNDRSRPDGTVEMVKSSRGCIALVAAFSFSC